VAFEGAEVSNIYITLQLHAQNMYVRMGSGAREQGDIYSPLEFWHILLIILVLTMNSYEITRKALKSLNYMKISTLLEVLL